MRAYSAIAISARLINWMTNGRAASGTGLTKMTVKPKRDTQFFEFGNSTDKSAKRHSVRSFIFDEMNVSMAYFDNGMAVSWVTPTGKR